MGCILMWFIRACVRDRVCLLSSSISLSLLVLDLDLSRSARQPPVSLSLLIHRSLTVVPRHRCCRCCCSRHPTGKVHGGLARAGKVKGQTPKVEKQTEGKKKPKTGRAKKRLAFNRRFSAAVAAPGGKRKGPNSQDK